MSDSGQTPPGPDGQEGGRRPRSYTGYVLVILILVITFLVVRNSIGEPAKMTFPEFASHSLEGNVKKVLIDNDRLHVTLDKRRGARSTEAIVSVPERFATDQALDMEEMAAMGREAARKDPQDLEALYNHLRRIVREGRPHDFAVYRRYLFEDDGVDKMLVRMSRPPLTDRPEERGGAGDVGWILKDSYLLEPRTDLRIPGETDEQGRPKTYSLGFNEILAATNPVDFNASLGIGSPESLTLAVTSGGQTTVAWTESDGPWEALLISLIPWLLIIAFLWFFVFRQMRGGGVGGNVLSFGRSRARVATKEKSDVTFKDVAGIEEAKAEVQEIVEFLKNPKRFARIGGRTPRGVLLNGSPGTGKTLLAKAIAGEANVPFFSISGSDFVEMFVGVGASRVRDLFKQARENSPCIIFLDEIDAVGRRRGAGLGGGHDEREQTLNAILVEMDGFDTDTGIIIIAATNRVDVLDPALLRPGRFDRQINVELPDVKGRAAILAVHARKVRMHPSVDLERIARGTPGFSGAELAAIVNEAAILATLANKDDVYTEDLEEARDRVRWGRAKTSRIMDEEDKKVTAYHEAGHALAARLLPKADPLHKVTIIPRGPALGVTMFLPEKDRYGLSRGQIEAYLRVCFGGRVAEELFIGDITSGAAGDIKQATAMARQMVQQWGMSEVVGTVDYSEGDENPFLGRDLGRQHRYSDATAERIDAEVKRVIDEAHRDCRELLESHKEQVEALAEALLTYETLENEEIDGLLSGVSVDTIRERRRAEEKTLEKDAARVRPAPAETPTPKPDLPPGLAGEGAR